MMNEKVWSIDPDHILNMDQTDIPFSYHSKKTLHTKGSKTIHVRAYTTDTKLMTLAATVTGSGKCCPQCFSSKGQLTEELQNESLKLTLTVGTTVVKKSMDG